MVFEEVQKFGGWVIWLMRGVVAAVAIGFILIYLTTELNSVAIIVLILYFFMTLLPILFVEFLRLNTRFDANGIEMRFKPLSKKDFKWSDVESADVIDYGFVGGWGIRLGTKYGTVYNTQGKEGVLLKLKTGKSVVIGTQRASELKIFLEKVFKPSSY